MKCLTGCVKGLGRCWHRAGPLEHSSESQQRVTAAVTALGLPPLPLTLREPPGRRPSKRWRPSLHQSPPSSRLFSSRSLPAAPHTSPGLCRRPKLGGRPADPPVQGAEQGAPVSSLHRCPHFTGEDAEACRQEEGSQGHGHTQGPENRSHARPPSLECPAVPAALPPMCPR